MLGIRGNAVLMVAASAGLAAPTLVCGVSTASAAGSLAVYQILDQEYANECLDGSESQGVRLNTCNGSAYQKWAYDPSDGSLHNQAYANECLDGSESQGVRLNTCNGGAYQNNALALVTGIVYALHDQEYSNECLDGSISQGVRLNTCNGGAYQQWMMLGVSDASDPSLPGVSVGADGWITYASSASALGVTGAVVTTVNGSLAADGSCAFNHTDNSSSANPAYQEEVGFNPTTCQVHLLSGSITPSAEASIADPADTNTTPDTPQVLTETGAAVSAVTPQNAPYDDTGMAQASVASVSPDVTYYSSAHTKTSWIDPINITITSLATNLRWPLYGAGGELTARNNGYKFKYDGWSFSGTPTPTFTTVSGGWGTGGAETFKNTDFEKYVLTVLGPAGWAACGFTTAPAVFKHNVHIYGYRSGGWYSTWNDSKAGGCSNLVHHRASYGYGWTQ